jgi:hypothetical protein
MQNAPTTTLNPTTSLTATRWPIVMSVATIVLLAALHPLSPELNPTFRMVSEYALGNYGWVLSLMFIAWSLSCLTLFLVIRSQTRTWFGKIGLVFLLLAAVGMAMASVYDVTQSLHGLAAAIGIPTLPIAAPLITASLLRNPAWAWSRRMLWWTANLPWISFALMLASVLIGLSQGGEFGVDIFVGWPNRLLIVAYCLWTATVAWCAGRLQEQ